MVMEGELAPGGLRERGCRATPHQGQEGAGSQTRFLCRIISFQQFYCNYPENAAIYRVSQTAAVPGGRGDEENGRAGPGGGGRRRQERKGNQTGRRVKGGWGEAAAEAEVSELQSQGEPAEEEERSEGAAGPPDLVSRPPCEQWAEGPQAVAKYSHEFMGKMGLNFLIPYSVLW